MTLALIQLALLAMLLFGALGSLLAALAYPLARSRLTRLTAAERAGFTMVWIALPVLLSVALTAACLMPSLVALLADGIGDHCLSHPDDHVHLCLVHQPAGQGSVAGWGLLVAIGLLALQPLVRAGRSLMAAHRAVAPLLDQARSDAQLGVAWVRCSLPVALTVGLLRPRVLVSEALRTELSQPLLDAVIAHERAHERKRDVATRALASLLVRFHLPHLREVLLEDLVVATELAADAAAAEAVGSPLCVADAILAVEHLADTAPPRGLALAFGEASVGARIEALLAPALPPRRRNRIAWAAGGAALASALAAPLHHAVETALTALVG